MASRDIDEGLREAERLIGEGKAADAEALCRELLAGWPDQQRILFTLGVALQGQSKMADAIDCYREVVQLEPEHPFAHNNLAVALYERRDGESALHHFKEAIRLQPERASLWANYARLLIDRGEVEDAKAAIQRAIALAPENQALKQQLLALAGEAPRAPEVEARRQRIWEIVPLAPDFDGMKLLAHPYLARTAPTNYRSPSLTTDEYGFRSLVRDGERFSYAEFTAAESPKAVVCGTSYIFGYGLAEEATLHGRLTAAGAGGALWYCFAVPLSNIVQQRIAFELFAPPDIRACVFFVGAMSACLALLTANEPYPCPPLFGLPTPGPRRTRTHSLDGGVVVGDIEASFSAATQTTRDSIEMIAARGKALGGCRTLFCFAPFLPWIDKPMCAEEHELTGLVRAQHRNIMATLEDPSLRDHWRDFIAAVGEASEAAGAGFIDFNQDPCFTGKDWLFLDDFHPTEKSVDHIMARITEWVDAG